MGESVHVYAEILLENVAVKKELKLRVDEMLDADFLRGIDHRLSMSDFLVEGGSFPDYTKLRKRRSVRSEDLRTVCKSKDTVRSLERLHEGLRLIHIGGHNLCAFGCELCTKVRINIGVLLSSVSPFA